MPAEIYRPPQWNEALSIATVMLIFPGQTNTPQYTIQGIGATLPKAQTRYIFDAVLANDHDQRITKTTHPVQTGANIADHAYIEPARVVLSIGMSDAMDSFSEGMWTGGATKSISAYQTLLAIQFSRIPLVLTTRLRTYSNVIIENISAKDTFKTIGGLRAVVTFSEIFVANTQVVTDSARPQDTQKTGLGAVTPQNPTPTEISQNHVLPVASHPMTTIAQPVASHTPSAAGVPVKKVDVPGAGFWSSVNNALLWPFGNYTGF